MNGTKSIQSTIETLSELERQRFFGTIEVKFEVGWIVLLRKTEAFKPNLETYRNTRGTMTEDHVNSTGTSAAPSSQLSTGR